MTEKQDANIGSRKTKESREVALTMLLAFLIAAYFKCDVQLFGLLIVGLTGKSAAFIYGNVKEHQARMGKAPEVAQ